MFVFLPEAMAVREGARDRRATGRSALQQQASCLQEQIKAFAVPPCPVLCVTRGASMPQCWLCGS